MCFPLLFWLIDRLVKGCHGPEWASTPASDQALGEAVETVPGRNSVVIAARGGHLLRGGRRRTLRDGTMEKVIYLLWRDPATSRADFAKRVRRETADRLLSLGAKGLQVNLCDPDVQPGIDALTQVNVSRPPVDGLIQVWVDSALARFRTPYDEAVRTVSPRTAGYLVTESDAIHNTRHPPVVGERTAGFAQIAMIQRPPRLDYDAWLDIWHQSHTAVGIETQSNFQYTQNVVVRQLTRDAPRFEAIVEECFPIEAMSDPHAFYDAVGDEAKFQRNLKEMMDSCARFIDFDRIDVAVTSQYVMKVPAHR
jgi:hypothetical protein